VFPPSPSGRKRNRERGAVLVRLCVAFGYYSIYEREILRKAPREHENPLLELTPGHLLVGPSHPSLQAKEVGERSTRLKMEKIYQINIEKSSKICA
jgi:hypothetical protein